MRFGPVLLVYIAFECVSGCGGMTGMASAQTSIGFSHPDSMEALLSYRLPDWGYRTISFQLGVFGAGEKNSNCTFCEEATSGAATEALRLSWYHESEQRVWSLGGGQNGRWNWNQTNQEPEDTIDSRLLGQVFLSGFNSNYIAGNLFLFESGSARGAYEESRFHEGSQRDLNLGRSFLGSLRGGVGLGRIRTVTPVLLAQRLSERLQALGRQPLPVEEVLRLASVLAQRGGYNQVFDRPDRRLWRDVLEPLLSRGETLTPFEVFYLSDVFYEALNSRREGFRIDLGAQVQRDTRDYGAASYSASHWGPSMGMEWSHNFNLDHQLSASVDGSYSWSEYDIADYDAKGKLGTANVSLEYQWVLADRFIWGNRLFESFRYSERTQPVTGLEIFREQNARLSSYFSFYVEDRVSMGPIAEVNWGRVEGDTNWTERLNWTMQFNIRYELDNTLF